MKSFVTWLTARQYRMVILTAAAMLPPMSMLGLAVIAQAVVVLAVLLRGVQAGLIVAVLASVLITIPALVSGSDAVAISGRPIIYLLVGLVNLLPAIGLAAILRHSRSLSLTIQIATIVIAAIVVLLFAVGSPVEVWQGLFAKVIGTMGDSAPELPEGFVSELSRIMTGMFGAITLLTSMLAVFIGRWWQAILSSPGAFGHEFKALRMGNVVGLIASVVFVLAALTKITLLENLTLVLVTAFLLHGLSVMHFVAGGAAGNFWLVAVYALMIVAMPFAQLVLAGLGFLDNWFDLRSRVARR